MLPAPAYAQSVDVYFNNQIVDCLVLETQGSPAVPAYVIVWKELSVHDQQLIIDTLAAASPPITLPMAGGLSDLHTVVLPTNGMSFLSTYLFAIKDISEGKPKSGKALDDSTLVYYNGSDWVRLIDDTPA